MHRSSFTAVVFGCFVAGACGVDAREPAATYLDDIQAEAGAFEESLAAHGASVEAVAGVAALAALEQAHLEDATTHLGGVGRDVEGMCRCVSMQGEAMAPDELRALVDEAMSECARHHAAMGHVADTADATAEEHHHQAAMTGMLDRMRGARDHLMMGGAAMYACPGG